MHAPDERTWTMERGDGIAVLRYGLPTPVSLPITAMAALADELDALAAEAVPPVVVLAVGILHADLQEVLELAQGRPIADFMPWNRAIAAVEAYPLPVLAAIPERATAGGCELSLACDVRVAAPAARIGLLETQLGIIPGAGGTQRLPRRVSPGYAAHLVFDGTAISGEEAWRIGLVEHLDADPVALATGLATRYAARGVPVLTAAKIALRAAAELPLSGGLRAEGKAFLSTLREPEAAARLQAWIDAPGEV